MKRCVIFILLLLMMVLYGCLKGDDATSTMDSLPSTEPTIRPTEPISNKSGDSEISSNQDEATAMEVRQFFDKYKNIFKKWDFKFRLGNHVEDDFAETDGNIYRYYTFNIECGENSTYAYFTTKNRGFEVEFERSGFSTKEVKEFIRATILVLDDTASIKKAKRDIKHLFKSWYMYEKSTNIKRSDILSYGDYKLYLREEKGKGDEAQEFAFRVVIVHNSQVNAPINKNEYKKFSYKAMKAKKNEDRRAYIVVNLKSNDEMNYFGDTDTLTFEDEDGRKYIIYSDYRAIGGKFIKGRSYHLYGCIASAYEGLPYLWIDYYETG